MTLKSRAFNLFAYALLVMPSQVNYRAMLIACLLPLVISRRSALICCFLAVASSCHGVMAEDRTARWYLRSLSSSATSIWIELLVAGKSDEPNEIRLICLAMDGQIKYTRNGIRNAVPLNRKNYIVGLADSSLVFLDANTGRELITINARGVPELTRKDAVDYSRNRIGFFALATPDDHVVYCPYPDVIVMRNRAGDVVARSRELSHECGEIVLINGPRNANGPLIAAAQPVGSDSADACYIVEWRGDSLAPSEKIPLPDDFGDVQNIFVSSHGANAYVMGVKPNTDSSNLSVYKIDMLKKKLHPKAVVNVNIHDDYFKYVVGNRSLVTLDPKERWIATLMDSGGVEIISVDGTRLDSLSYEKARVIGIMASNEGRLYGATSDGHIITWDSIHDAHPAVLANFEPQLQQSKERSEP